MSCSSPNGSPDIIPIPFVPTANSFCRNIFNRCNYNLITALRPSFPGDLINKYHITTVNKKYSELKQFNLAFFSTVSAPSLYTIDVWT